MRFCTGLLMLLVAFALSATETSAASAKQLVATFSGDDAVARFEAEERLTAMGDDALAALAPLATSTGYAPARRYAIHTVAAIGTPKAIDLLLRVLKNERNIHARGLACMHLGRLGVEEAVPLIGKWLSTIRGRPIGQFRHPVVLKPAGEWMRHVDALREIGSEKGIPILEAMIKAGHGGQGGRALMRTYREALFELQREKTFRDAVRSVPKLEVKVKVLFDFFRRDTLARIRLHRMKLVGLGTEGRWVLEDLRKHPDAKTRDAAAAVLSAYPRLQRRKGASK